MPTTISIVLCAYNAELTISFAIESILAQDREFSELIIIDDGSTDKTHSIAKGYAASIRKIKVILQSNSGIGISRNRGISEAIGDWIAFIDADDFWHPSKLAIQMNAAEKYDTSDAIISDSIEFFQDSDLKTFKDPIDKASINCIEYLNLSEQLLEKNFNFPPATVVWRSIFLKAIGGYGNHRNGEDFAPFINLAARGGRLIRIKQPLYAVRHSAGSLSRSTSNHYVGAMARIDAIENLQHQIRQHTEIQYFIESQALSRAKQRFLRWALSGIRNGYSEKMQMRMAKPLLRQIESRSTRLLEWMKTIASASKHLLVRSAIKKIQ